MEKKKDINPYLKVLYPVVDCIADFLGSDCEVVLHDISEPEKSIIKICNSHVTGRKIGDPLTNVALEMIEEGKKGMTLLGNYNPITKNGFLLKSNAANIWDPDGNQIGILCINHNIQEFQRIQHTLQSIQNGIAKMTINKEKLPEKIESEGEIFESDIWSIINTIIDRMIMEKGKPVESLSKEDRIEIIQNLNNSGVFNVKSAHHIVAKKIGISTPTIYRYLEESRLEETVKTKPSTSAQTALQIPKK